MAVYTYVPPYLANLNIDLTNIVLIVTILPLNSVIFPPLLGNFSDKLQKRKEFFLIGGFGLILTFILLILIKNVIILMVLLILYGICSSSYGIIYVLFQELTLNKKEFVSYYQALVALGWFMGAFLGGIFVDFFGIENIFIFLLYMAFINILIILFIQENRENILKLHSDNEKYNLWDENSQKADIPFSIYLGLFFRNFAIRPILSILAIIMAYSITNDFQIGFLISINPLIQFFLMILIGRVINERNLKKILIIGYFFNALVILGYIISNGFLDFLTFQILISLSYSMFWNATQIYIAQRTTPKNKGKYMGYATTSFFLGSLLGGLFFSFLISVFINIYLAMLFLIMFPLFSGLIIWFKFEKIPKQRKK
jgi:MFS family permease